MATNPNLRKNEYPKSSKDIPGGKPKQGSKPQGKKSQPQKSQPQTQAAEVDVVESKTYSRPYELTPISAFNKLMTFVRTYESEVFIANPEWNYDECRLMTTPVPVESVCHWRDHLKSLRLLGSELGVANKKHTDTHNAWVVVGVLESMAKHAKPIDGKPARPSSHSTHIMIRGWCEDSSMDFTTGKAEVSIVIANSWTSLYEHFDAQVRGIFFRISQAKKAAQNDENFKPQSIESAEIQAARRAFLEKKLAAPKNSKPEAQARPEPPAYKESKTLIVKTKAPMPLGEKPARVRRNRQKTQRALEEAAKQAANPPEIFVPKVVMKIKSPAVDTISYKL